MNIVELTRYSKRHRDSDMANIDSLTSHTHLFITTFCRSIGLWIILEYY